MPLRRIYKSSASCYIDQGNPQKHFIEINDGRFMEDSPNTASYNCENVLTNKSSEVNIDARENNEDVIPTNTDKHVAKASTSLTKVTVNESAGYIGTQADLSKENSIEHIWDNSKNHILGNTVEQVRDESEIFSDNNSSGFARGDSIEYAQSVSVKCTKIVLKKNDNMFNKGKERKMKDLMEAITDLLNDIDEELEYSTSIESPGYNSEMEDSFTDSSNDKEVASESGSSSDDEEVASESRSSSDDKDPDNISDMEDSSDTSSEDTSNDSHTSNDSFNTSSEITANALTRIPFSSLYRQIFEEKILQNL